MDPLQRLNDMRSPLVIAAFMVMLAGCGTDAEPNLAADGSAEASDSTETTATSSAMGLAVTTRPEIDGEAILQASGFRRCQESGVPLEGDVDAERGQELLFAAVEAGISQGGSPGGDGYLPRIDLFVLDEPTLATLASFADPDELCVEGADPNDYVALGPQQLSGPGWRWVGAGTGVAFGAGPTVIDNKADYDQLWSLLGEGPETEQIAIDFDAEVILTYTHGSGVNFGACGVRFDGYGIDDDATVVLDFFSPGGSVFCEGAAWPAVYAVALERGYVGDLPFVAEVRRSPRAEPTRLIVGVGPPAVEREPIDEPAPEPIPTTEPAVLSTAPPVVADFAAGTISTPAFPNRAGSTEPGGVDVPVPEGWDGDPATAMASVTGRGGLQVATFDSDDLAWRIMADPAELDVTDGPTAIAVPLYQATPDGIVTTGESASIQQYRHGSTNPDTWLRRIVWVYAHGDFVTVAVLAYPEFPDGSSFDTDDPLQASLAGQDPTAIMTDIRYFSAS